MKLLLNQQNVIVAISNSIESVRVVAGEWQICDESQKEAWLNISENTSYDKRLNVIEVTTLPQDIIKFRYCYNGESFYLNPEYIAPEVLRNEIIDAYTLQLIEEGMI